MTHRFFGEIEVSPTVTGEYLANLDCKMPYPIEMSLVIHDELGHFYGGRKFKLKKGKSTLTFPLIDIDPGRYGVCIEADGKTYLRHLFIKKRETSGILSVFRRLISGNQAEINSV